MTLSKYLPEICQTLHRRTTKSPVQPTFKPSHSRVQVQSVAAVATCSFPLSDIGDVFIAMFRIMTFKMLNDAKALRLRRGNEGVVKQAINGGQH